MYLVIEWFSVIEISVPKILFFRAFAPRNFIQEQLVNLFCQVKVIFYVFKEPFLLNRFSLVPFDMAFWKVIVFGVIHDVGLLFSKIVKLVAIETCNKSSLVRLEMYFGQKRVYSVPFNSPDDIKLICQLCNGFFVSLNLFNLLLEPVPLF